jgi:hypothetical protein
MGKLGKRIAGQGGRTPLPFLRQMRIVPGLRFLGMPNDEYAPGKLGWRHQNEFQRKRIAPASKLAAAPPGFNQRMRVGGNLAGEFC